MTTLITPALPLAHTANTDAPGHWEAREAALVALRERFVAEGHSLRDAGRFALASLDAELEAAPPAPAPAAGFAPLEVAELLDALCLAHDYAASVVPGGPWLRALDAAWGYILQADTLYYDAERHALRVESATRPGRFYEANGSCACEAFTRGEGICWHRAAARLVARALDLQARAARLVATGDAAPERALAWASAELGYPIRTARAA